MVSTMAMDRLPPWFHLNHKLYGTTTGGGLRDCGTVFEVTTAGQERIVYSFRGYPNDGFEPTGDLIAVDGDLYGTTYSGGNQNSGGTVFKVNPSTGRETVLHRFGPGADGSEPRAGLLYLHGSFYGTTVYGGANALGTIFEVGTNGKERVLYSFRGVPDGFAPNGDLTAVDGTIYGTTVNGGSSACFNSVGCGTAFAFDPPSGEERVLHAFGVGSDGAFPLAGLVAVGRALYGTTYSGGGGMKCGGCGTIFELDVSGPSACFTALRAVKTARILWLDWYQITACCMGPPMQAAKQCSRASEFVDCRRLRTTVF